MEGRVTFPTEIAKGDWPIRPGDKTLYLIVAQSGLRSLIDKKVPREKGFVKVSEGSIPILIDAHYTSKGEAYIDRSLYMLTAECVIYEDVNKLFDVKFTGLIFIKRFAPDEWVSTEYLDKLIEDKNGFYLPPKSP